jgi:hypothetical protein
MKTLLLSLLLLVANATAANATEARYVIGLTPFLEKANKDDVYRRIVGMMLEDLPLKSSLAIYDAYHLTNITRIEIPDVRAFQSGKTRANQFKDQVLKLRQFLATEHARPTNAPIEKLNFDNALRLPQFMDFIAENIAADHQPLSVLLIGSPLYVDHKEPGFSMVDGYFPSDGHLNATRDQSIYGLRPRGADALQNVTVHFGYLGDPWVSAIHQEKIARFWTLYLERQGAHLATFCGDLATLFNAARTPTLAARENNFTLDRAQTKIEMLRISRDVGAADWITRDVLSGPRPAPPTKTIGPMKIGIRWKGDIDLDLYAAASADSETLFFEHTRVAEGYYFKDHRSSPEREYEFIEFERPVDVNRVQADINFYKGSLPTGPNGEIRIEFEGRIYSGKFQIEAAHGNKGRAGSSQTTYWAHIDVPSILGLRTDRN